MFFAARSLEVGPRAIQAVQEKTRDIEAQGIDKPWLLDKTNQWVLEGEAWASRVGRRYGYFGYAKGAAPDAVPVGGAVGGRIAGDVANAVVAYAATKVRGDFADCAVFAHIHARRCYLLALVSHYTSPRLSLGV